MNSNLDEFIDNKVVRMQLVEARKSSNLTQKDISEKTGLSVSSIHSIENNIDGNPTLKSLIKYLECLDMEICFRKKHK